MKHALKTWLLIAALFHLPFAVATPTQEPEEQAAATRSANLGLFLFIHNQVSYQETAELRQNLNRFLAHLEEVTGRRTVVTVIDDADGATDFDYRGEADDELLYKWNAVSIDYANQHNLPLPSQRHKYMLVTSNKLNWTYHGISVPSLNIGIASLKDANTLPHEIGHLFGADHDAATGFPCQTIMWGRSTTSINACHYFSDANQDAIRSYLSEVP